MGGVCAASEAIALVGIVTGIALLVVFLVLRVERVIRALSIRKRWLLAGGVALPLLGVSVWLLLRRDMPVELPSPAAASVVTDDTAVVLGKVTPVIGRGGASPPRVWIAVFAILKDLKDLRHPVLRDIGLEEGNAVSARTPAGPKKGPARAGYYIVVLRPYERTDTVPPGGTWNWEVVAGYPLTKETLEALVALLEKKAITTRPRPSPP